MNTKKNCIHSSVRHVKEQQNELFEISFDSCYEQYENYLRSANTIVDFYEIESFLQQYTTDTLRRF